MKVSRKNSGLLLAGALFADGASGVSAVASEGEAGQLRATGINADRSEADKARDPGRWPVDLVTFLIDHADSAHAGNAALHRIEKAKVVIGG